MPSDRRLHRIDLNLMVALDVLLEERHVTRAAQRLSVGQSAMSATLTRLRRVFDDQLLVREGHTLTLTPYAESLIDPLREVLDAMDALLATREGFDPSTMPRTFRITATDYVSLIFLQPFMARLAEREPLVKLEIRTLGADFAERLAHNDTDLVIAPREVVDEHTASRGELLFSEEYVAVVAEENDLGGANTLTEKVFRSLPRLGTSSGEFPTVAERLLGSGRLGNFHAVMTVSASVAPFMVQGTPFVALVPRRLGEYAQRYHRIRVFDAPMPLPPFHEGMFWAARTERDASHLWLRQQLKAYAENLSSRVDLGAAVDATLS